MKKRIRHFFGGIKGALVVAFTFLLFPIAKLILFKKKIWIISERENECRDNGYVFYKYVKENHPEITCFYAINKDSPDYAKISKYGTVLQFGSFKHFFYFCGARFLICSTTQCFCPSYYLMLLRKKFHLWGKYIFLQHGVIKDDLPFLYKKATKIDLFICGAKPEYDYVKERFGYRKNEVVYTGLARFDLYNSLNCINKIIVMPTWRRTVAKDNFTDTNYYKMWSNFLNNNSLAEILNKNNIQLLFYIHPLFQKYSNMFISKNDNIIIADFEHYNLQNILIESSLMITDFSSVAFDFGYMKKPVIYYQYDENDFFKTHYSKGYFDYRKDGFGPVVNSLQDLIKEIEKYITNEFCVERKYLNNHDMFFQLHDSNNSKRIFDEICKL